VFDQAFIEQLAAAGAAKLPRPASGRWPALMNIKDAAEYMGRSEGGIRHLVEAGLLPVCKMDARVQIRRVDMDRVIEQHTG
jgi:Helix-turn-helix domain